MESKRIKLDNNNKIFQDILYYRIIESIIDYLLIKKKNNNNNNNNNNNIYYIKQFYNNINELFNYILVSKKWYQHISLTISNNIIDNKSFEYWFKINYNSQKSPFTNNQKNIENQYNIICFKNKQNQINQEYSIIKINQSITTNYFKNKLYLNYLTVEDFKEIQKQLEDNQLQYDRIVIVEDFVDRFNIEDFNKLYKYVSHQKDQEKLSKIFKILELNYKEIDVSPKGFNVRGVDTEFAKLYFNNLKIVGCDDEKGDDDHTLKILKYLKSKNIIYDGSTVACDSPTYVTYTPLFDPDVSGQQVESIKIVNKMENVDGYVEPPDLFKVNQFENLHSIQIPMYFHCIFSIISGYDLQSSCENNFSYSIYDTEDFDSLESDLKVMVNSLITSKSLRNLKISSICSSECINRNIFDCYYEEEKECDFNINVQNKIKKINNTKQTISNSFKPLFSELNTSIESIKLDCYGSMNTNTFSDLLKNKSIKYLELKNSDFINYKFKELNIDPKDRKYRKNLPYEKEIISINQYLIENIFTSPLTSIRHYGTQIDKVDQLKSIFNSLTNNIFKLQIYSIKFYCKETLKNDLLIEINDLKSYISTQQHQQSNKAININLKEIKASTLKERKKEINNNNNNLYFILN